ncbi:hypothetical protein LINPERHAP2_LOCUS31092 [Linum perenne]
MRKALEVHPDIKGPIVTIYAHGDFSDFQKGVQEGLHRTDVQLVQVPNGRKNASDLAILVDMFVFAMDHRPPSTIVHISGDVDFARALHVLGKRGYTIILVIPSNVQVNNALRNDANFVWDWGSLARGECLPADTVEDADESYDQSADQNEEEGLNSPLSVHPEGIVGLQ